MGSFERGRMMSGMGSDARDGDKPEIQLRDVWDWIYCPLRVWWRKIGIPKGATHSTIVSGESLVRRSVRAALKAYYRISRAHSPKTISAATALGFVWRSWMERWGLGEDMIRDLLEYQERRRQVLDRIEKGEDGSKVQSDRCTPPMWSREWREQAAALGLLDMRAHIDSQAKPIGVRKLALPESELERGPMGFADAFATSVDIVQRMKDLPAPAEVLAAQEPVIADLLASRLISTADLVVDAGRSNARGRPRKDRGGPRQRQNLTYELHLFEPEIPVPLSIERDMHVLALGQALPESLEFEADEVGVKSITIRHMLTGEVQSIQPGIADGADILDSLVRGFQEGIRLGAYLPRMACGWHACGDCEYRGLCFADRDRKVAFNPPIESQIHADQAMFKAVGALVGRTGTPADAAAVLKPFLRWMSEHPELKPENALWLIDALEASGQ